MFNNMNFSNCDRWVGKIIWGPFSFHKSKNLGGFLRNTYVISLDFLLLCRFPNNPKTPKAAAQILDNSSWRLCPGPSFFHATNAPLVISVTPEFNYYLDTDASPISSTELCSLTYPALALPLASLSFLPASSTAFPLSSLIYPVPHIKNKGIYYPCLLPFIFSLQSQVTKSSQLFF